MEGKQQRGVDNLDVGTTVEYAPGKRYKDHFKCICVVLKKDPTYTDANGAVANVKCEFTGRFYHVSSDEEVKVIEG